MHRKPRALTFWLCPRFSILRHLLPTARVTIMAVNFKRLLIACHPLLHRRIEG